MVSVPRHPKAANWRSVLGGPMPSHREYVEMILRFGAALALARRWAQPVKESICAARTVTAPNNLMHLIDATIPEERCDSSTTAKNLHFDAHRARSRDIGNTSVQRHG